MKPSVYAEMGLGQWWTEVRQLTDNECSDLWDEFLSTVVPPVQRRPFTRGFGSTKGIGRRMFMHVSELEPSALVTPGLDKPGTKQDASAKVLWGLEKRLYGFHVAGSAAQLSELFLLEFDGIAHIPSRAPKEWLVRLDALGPIWEVE